MDDSPIGGESPLGQQIGLPVDADGWERDLGSPALPWPVRVPSAHDGFRATLRRHEIDDIVAVSWSAMPSPRSAEPARSRTPMPTSSSSTSWMPVV